LRESGLLPRGGIARFYGTAKIYKSGPIYEEIWNRLIEPEKKGDPDKKGFRVLIKVERAEDLGGAVGLFLLGAGTSLILAALLGLIWVVPR
jgi:hypothetical protein